MPVSLAQLLIPRVELHLFYNTIVTVPMIVAMLYHMYRTGKERAQISCGCGKRLRHAFPERAINTLPLSS